MAKGYCVFKGTEYTAKRIRNQIKIFSSCENAELEKVIDEYGQEIWQKYISINECEDYYEVSFALLIDDMQVGLSLTSGGDWLIETEDEVIARRLSMSEVDRNFWRKELDTFNLFSCQYVLIYKHINSEQDQMVKTDVWGFLDEANRYYSVYSDKYIAYKNIIISILQREHEQSQAGANRIYTKIVEYEDLFNELIYLCKTGELKEEQCVVVEGYSAIQLYHDTYLTRLGALNYLGYLRRNPEKALADLKAGLPRK